MSTTEPLRRLTVTLAVLLTLLIGCSKKGNDPIGNTPRTEVPPELVGEWHSSQKSYLGFYNRSTGQWGEPSGSGFSYKFTSDGHFEYGGFLQSTSSACSLSFFDYKIGTVTIDGPTITTHPQFSQIRKDDSCNPHNNYDKPGMLEAQSVTWRVAYAFPSMRLYLTMPDGIEHSFSRQ